MEKTSMGFITQTLLGAAAGMPVGALLMGGERMLNPPGVMEFPEQSVEMPLASQKPAPKKKAKPKKEPEKKTEEKKAGFYTGLPGAAIGAGAGYRLAGELLDRARSKELSSILAKREGELNDLLLQEQELAGGMSKRSEDVDMDSTLATIGECVYDELEKSAIVMPEGGAELMSKFQALHPATKTVLGALALAGMSAGGYLGYSRTAEADPRRARVAAMKKLLRERLTRGESQGPMIMKVTSNSPSLTPVRPGATSLAPGMGRDVLEGI